MCLLIQIQWKISKNGKMGKRNMNWNKIQREIPMTFQHKKFVHLQIDESTKIVFFSHYFKCSCKKIFFRCRHMNLAILKAVMSLRSIVFLLSLNQRFYFTVANIFSTYELSLSPNVCVNALLQNKTFISLSLFFVCAMFT